MRGNKNIFTQNKSPNLQLIESIDSRSACIFYSSVFLLHLIFLKTFSLSMANNAANKLCLMIVFSLMYLSEPICQIHECFRRYAFATIFHFTYFNLINSFHIHSNSLILKLIRHARNVVFIIYIHIDIFSND